MKKKILVVTVSLLLVAMFVTPTIAMDRNPNNPKKIPIKMVRDGANLKLVDSRVTDGNVAHGTGIGITWDWYNIVDIQHTNPAENMSILDGTYDMTGKFEVNLNNPGIEIDTGMGIGVFGTGHLVYKVLIDFGEGNTFKGIMTCRGMFLFFKTGPYAGAATFEEGVSRSVLQGTGIYKGWTIIWQREPIPGPTPGYIYWDAYMLIP